MKNVAAVVLAAGKGTRIGQHLPKVLYPIAGKPMIYYTLETLSKIPTKEFYVVIGFRAEDVKASIGRNTHFVYQEKQLGTAHAVKLALNELSPDIEHVLVVNGDDSYKRKCSIEFY
jgi:bifunctional UDP-N-acetylglucosamine pyrophosphorylase/glucosamine-1-phosphate N-acetyltransferase